MDQLALYHRSFVDVTENARKAYDRPDPLIASQHVAREPVAGSVEGYQWLAKTLRSMDLYAKPGQNFTAYATAWERRCSALVPGTGGAGETQLDPVVGQREMAAGFPVVAHYGVVPGGHIIVPRQYRFHEGQLPLRQLVEKEIPAFVTRVTYPTDAGGWAEFDHGDVVRYSVLTDLEGRILTVLKSSLKDDSIESADPFLYLMVAQLLVAVGAAAGRRLILAMTRKSAEKEVRAVVTSLEKAKLKWGEASVIEGGAAKGVASEIEIAKATMQRTMPQVVDGATNKLAMMSFKELNQVLQKAGFKAIKAEKFGPEGGYQVFYQNGNVVARFKSLGDKLGTPRGGQTHISFSLSDGKGLQWMNDMAKFNANGKLAPKLIVDPKKFDPSKDFQGNPHKYPVIDSKYDIKVVDNWANSTHFNAPPGFKLDGVDAVVRPLVK